MHTRATPGSFFHSSARTTGWTLTIIMCVMGVLCGFAFFIFLTGCTRPDKSPPYLIRVGDREITVDEFKQTVSSVADEAIAGVGSLDADGLNQLRVQVLEQFIDELIIIERGKELGMSISEDELEAAVTRIKADYPDNTFDETLLENAVAFEVWKRKMAVRLLVEKIIASELIDQVQLSPEDIANYYQSLPKSERPGDGSNDDEQNEKIVRQLRRLKAEDAYQKWIDRLKEQYPVKINREQWEILVRVEN